LSFNGAAVTVSFYLREPPQHQSPRLKENLRGTPSFSPDCHASRIRFCRDDATTGDDIAI
jgi:hypothetical protein